MFINITQTAPVWDSPSRCIESNDGDEGSEITFKRLQSRAKTKDYQIRQTCAYRNRSVVKRERILPELMLLLKEAFQ